MTVDDACLILNIDKNLLSVDLVKEGFRKKALITHPDKGGNINDFLLVQAAYEYLLNYFNNRDFNEEIWTETPRELKSRLDQIASAFDLVTANYEKFSTSEYFRVVNWLAGSMNILKSAKEIDEKWSNLVKQALERFTGNIYQNFKSQIEEISNTYDHWLVAEMQASISAARANYLSNMLSKPLFYVFSILVTGVFFIGYITFLTPPIDALSIFSSIFIVVMGFSIGKVMFNEYANSYFKSYKLPKMVEEYYEFEHKYFYYNLEKGPTKENLSSHYSFQGIQLGWMFGGWVGVIIGGILGALWGWISGETLDDLKTKVLDHTKSNLSLFIQKYDERMLDQIKRLKESYIKAAQENFNKASKDMILLLTK